MKELMIDLETWALHPGAAIRSLGAVFFDFDTGTLGPEFYMNVDDNSCDFMGMGINPETQRWWSEQSPEAQAAFAHPTPRHIVYVLELFNDWIRVNTPDPKEMQVWSHGSVFDVAIVQELMRLCNLKEPWSHRGVRDTRTLIWLGNLGGEIPWDEFVGTPHHALHDAIHQARHMIKILQTIKGTYHAGKNEGDSAGSADGNVGPGQTT